MDVCRALKARIEARGIPCVLRNETREPTLGGTDIPLLGSRHPELWILDDLQLEQAVEILHPCDAPVPTSECTGGNDDAD